MHETGVLCKVLGVSRNGYYAWISRPKSNRAIDNERLLERIRKSHTNSRMTYGYRRVYQDLVSEQIAVAKNRVHRLMKENGFAAINSVIKNHTPFQQKLMLKLKRHLSSCVYQLGRLFRKY